MSRTQQEMTSSDVDTNRRAEDRWPRVLEWLDSWVPTDLARRVPSIPLRVEEIRQDGVYTLRMEIPGIDPDHDIDISIDDSTLTVTGRRTESEETAERSEFVYGEFARMLTLPRGVELDSVKAAYRGGILEITMHVDEGAATSRRIPIAGE